MKKFLVCLKVKSVLFFLDFFVKKISVLIPSITILLLTTSNQFIIYFEQVHYEIFFNLKHLIFLY